MKFNNFQNNGPQKLRVCLIVILFLIFVGVAYSLIVWLIPLTSNFSKGLTTAEVISVLALITSILLVFINLGKYILAYQTTTKKAISLDIRIKDTKAIIKCIIENNGQKRITPQNVFVFVEQGHLSDGVYDFPFLLKHEKGEKDCNLSKKCKNGDICSFPLELIPAGDTAYRKVIKLKHLSSEAIMYIDPGEMFSDSIVLELEKGVYRVMVIATSVKDDCMCSNENFIIK